MEYDYFSPTVWAMSAQTAGFFYIHFQKEISFS